MAPPYRPNLNVPTASNQSEVPSAAASATGSTHGADSKRHPGLASVAQQKAPPRPPSRSSSTTGPNTGKQPIQRTVPAQSNPALSKFYSTQSTEDLTNRASPAGDTRPAARTGGNPSTNPGERGRGNQISAAADPASRESSPGPSEGEGTSGSEASDDEDRLQDSVYHGQPDTSAHLPGRGSGGVTATAVAPSSGGSSPIRSEDISGSESFNSGDSSRGSPGNTPEKHRIPKSGKGGPGPEYPSGFTGHPEIQEYGQVIDTSGNPDPYSSTVTPHAPSVNLPKTRIENTEDTREHSAAHLPPVELRSLTDLGGECPAATEAVKYLFQAVGRDVVSFRRNTQVSYMVVERAREIVGAINEYIAKVENSVSVDGDWDSFEKFTVAIEPLEDILFKLLAFTEDEKARYFASTTSIDECVSSAESWASNREELSNALEGFHTRQELVGLFQEPETDTRELERQKAQIHDDRSLLDDMRKTIHNLITEDPNRFPSYVRDVKTSLDKLQLNIINGSPPDWLTVITIQTSMLVEGAMEMVKDAVLDREILNHLKSRPVWKAASELVGVLEGVDRKQPTLPQVVQAKYDAFIRALTNCVGPPPPPNHAELLKQAGRIRRPFQAQAFALIMLCRFLADKFTALGDSAATVENFNSLEDAFEVTLVALQAAAKAVNGLKYFDMSNFEGHSMVKAFGDAEALIRDIFRSLNLDAEWAQRQSELTAALNKDKERMIKLNEMLNRSPEPTTAKVAVHVSIHDKSPDGLKLGASSVEEDPTMRLLALRWNVASVLKQEDIKRARTAGTFYKQTNGRWSEIVPSSSTLSEIVGSQSEVALRLVIT